MNTMKTAVLAGLVTMLMATMVNADVIALTDTQSFTGSSATRNFVLAKFDPALGTLNSVTVTMSGSSVVTFQYENFSDMPVAGNITASIAGDVKLRSDGVDLTTTPYSESKNIYLNLTAFDGTGGYVGADTSTTLFSTIVATSASRVYLPGEFANFIGDSGNCPELVIAHSTLRSYNGLGDNSARFITANNYTATVVYDYTPVPEPATMTLLVLGGLAMIRRRNHK